MTLSDFSPARIEAWLDAHGRGAWIIAIVLGFITFWPIGLALLLWMLWRGKAEGARRRCGKRLRARAAFDNAAFADHHEQTLRRLEEDAEAFENHLQEEARERDRKAFAAFMATRNHDTSSAARLAE